MGKAIPSHSHEAIPISIPVPGSMDFHSHPRLNARVTSIENSRIVILNVTAVTTST